jgi:hypothetical protein
MESIFPHGNGVESIWKIPHGIHVEISYEMVESIPFHVEYRWKKITKMGEISAKTYSMWNRQIPCGTTTTWIPHGFHMDSM